MKNLFPQFNNFFRKNLFSGIFNKNFSTRMFTPNVLEFPTITNIEQDENIINNDISIDLKGRNSKEPKRVLYNRIIIFF
jgi:hypothetical protein